MSGHINRSEPVLHLAAAGRLAGRSVPLGRRKARASQGSQLAVRPGFGWAAERRKQVKRRAAPCIAAALTSVAHRLARGRRVPAPTRPSRTPGGAHRTSGPSLNRFLRLIIVRIRLIIVSSSLRERSRLDISVVPAQLAVCK